jgi:hypothetical protein
MVWIATDSWQAALFQAIQQYGQAARPTVKKTCADKHGRDQANSYIHKDGELTGIIKLVAGWHAIGHRVRISVTRHAVAQANVLCSINNKSCRGTTSQVDGASHSQ